jgi:hypothetical protein
MLASDAAFGVDMAFASGEAQVGLLELYTSEGCSSCPPADRWLSGLQNEPGLWHEFVPVAFHVDYWDDIGWKDRFDSPAYTERQRTYERQGAVSAVYTPGVLRATLAGNSVSVRFRPRMAQSARFVVNLAVLGSGLTTAVQAGENRGRQLRHDFVVLGTTS